MNQAKTKIVTLDDNGVTDNLTCDLYQKLPLGTKVTHKQEGQVGEGTVLDVDYQGLYAWGGHCFTAKIQWSNGETWDCSLGLLIIQK